ncbi:peptide-methionine (S)-S-oxide reductase MsrA [Pseudenhygromyxa sp. WMMC2535]|uniref:peptide-methionine (S)-S-oxide reductase MsrA n=1 Tax=Pseudenhygromyxa sp. WMMC2535 TaxID=2712867 RepID=UPI0015561005|nr:peptide-methionine (S)-S-oxide reductase MsrA [Pseudenhygromyxa sp. WMMC2535]NVB39357.1 peptide-methionine (S)-S-oxide reductase MsrA [Pseudenhygromyxa sp. WMMC2535]
MRTSAKLAVSLLLTACSSTGEPAAAPDTHARDSEASGEGRATDTKRQQNVNSGPATRDPVDVPIDAAALEAAGGVAYFAGGCFWGVEHYMSQLPGVLRVESGYMGGSVEDPSYEDVLSHESGHLETVRVYFDPQVVGYREVAKRFFEIHDPTQANGQGPDIGPQYLSAIFVTDETQRAAVEELISLLEARDYDVVTTIEPAGEFWPAEDYHQNYYVEKGSQPYCHTWTDRFGDGR